MAISLSTADVTLALYYIRITSSFPSTTTSSFLLDQAGNDVRHSGNQAGSGAVLGGESSSAATSAGSSNGFCPDALVLESRVQRVLVWTGFTDFASHLQNLSVCSNDRGRELSGRQLREGLNDASEFAAPSLLFGRRRTRVQRSSVQTGSMNAAF